MFKLKTTKGIGERVKSYLIRPIQYEVRIENGDWSAYFGKYQNQKWGWWDTNDCWCLSGVNCVEDQLEYLWKNGHFSAEAKKFFTDNGYIDADGDFSLSERFIAVLSGVKDDGNGQMEFWRLAQIYGLIPRKDLTYTSEQASRFIDKGAFNADYFNPLAVTDAMRAKGQEFLRHVNIARQWIGKPWTTPNIEILKAALKQAPLQIGVPVPEQVYLWNNPAVAYDGRKAADHAVELYKIADDGSFYVFDQYEPHLKTLSKDYYLPFVTQGIVTAVKPLVALPVPQPSPFWVRFWTAVMNWYNAIPNTTPIGGEKMSYAQVREMR